MYDVTVSAFSIFKKFPDNEAARLYLEERRWHGEPVCPHCHQHDRITVRGGKRQGYYRCRACCKEFTVRTGTIFERSHVDLHKWIFAMYILVTARKGISSLQLAKEIGVTQKTAWFVLQRLREACGGDFDKLSGIVEIDEAFVGGKESNKHVRKKLRAGRGSVGKQPVLGLRERGGRSVAVPIEGTALRDIRPVVDAMVERGTMLYTDEHPAYRRLPGYGHAHVNHGAGEFVGAGDISTNSVESMWAVLKRGLYGTWHHASRKHLSRYLNECTFRLNDGNVRHHTHARINSLVDGAFQHRLTYEGLTA